MLVAAIILNIQTIHRQVHWPHWYRIKLLIHKTINNLQQTIISVNRQQEGSEVMECGEIIVFAECGA
jgi:hypothetical protein